MSAFRSLKGNCPVCNGARKDCRQNTLTNLIHCRDTEANPPDYSYVKEDKLGFAMWAYKPDVEARNDERRKEWRQQQEARKQQRFVAERQRKAESLDPQTRDRAYREILSQLTLHPDDKADLLRRGLSEEEIQRNGFKSVRQWQRLDREIDNKLPGVNIDGRSLNTQPGYLCPVRDANGHIVAMQLRLRDDAEGGRYRWLTSRTQQRPNGQSAHVGDELPLAVHYPDQITKPGTVGFAEGTAAKPFLAAERCRMPVIGASGGQWASSPELLKAYLDAIARRHGAVNQLVLFPDAGSQQNRHIMRNYRKLKDLLATWGYNLAIAWWGQAVKSDPDIDELEAVAYKNIEYIRWEEFYSKQYRQSQQNPQAFQRPAELSRSEWELKFGFPQQLLEIGSFVKKTYQKLIAKGFGKQQEPVAKNSEIKAEPLPITYNPEPEKPTSTAIVLRSQWQQWCEAKPSKILYERAKLLTKEQWQALGCPVIEFEGGDRLLILKEFYDLWEIVIVLESSDVGQAKSHDAGRLTSRHLTGDKGRVFYNDNNHRNPSTATVERNFADHVSRHDGLKYDRYRKTPSGFDHVVRLKPGETPDIPGNCPETETFTILNQDKNLIVCGGKYSPVCGTCRHLLDPEGKVACGFLNEKRDTLKYEKQIRQHLAQSVPARTQEDEEGTSASSADVFVVEEVGSSLKPYKTVEVSKHDLAHAFQELKQKDPVLAEIAQPLFDTLYNLMGAEKLPEHGLDFPAVRSRLLPHVPDIYNAASSQLWDRWLTEGWENGTPNASLYSFLSTSIRRALNPNLGNLINRNQTPEQKQAIIRDQVPLNWISLVLDAILENKAHLHIDDVGRLHITRYSNRIRSIMDTYKMVVLMDATLSKDEVAQLTHISKSDIVEIRQSRPDFSNQTIHLIKGLGSGSKKRRDSESEYSVQNRIQKLTAYIESLHPDGKTGLIDHQAFHSRCGEILQAGYWGRDNRGSNEFMECLALILVGTPYPNLGQAAAEYHAETGKVVSPSGLAGSFGHWVRSKVRAEVYQAIGRPRAHLRPHQQISVYIAANSVVTAADLRSRFPGCTVKEVDVADFCPEAAPKGEQTRRLCVEILARNLETNPDTTTSDIANQMGISRGRVSQICSEIFQPLGLKGGFNHLKSLLVLLFKANNTKLTPLEDLPEDVKWIAQTYLGLMFEDFPDNPVGVVREVLRIAKASGYKQFQQILSVAAPEVIEKLLDSLLKVLIPGCQRLLDAPG